MAFPNLGTALVRPVMSGGRVPYIVGLAGVVMVGIAGVALKNVAFAGYSPLPSDFDGPLVFRQVYTLEHQTLLTNHLTTYSQWSSGVNTQLGFYLMDIIGALFRAAGAAVDVPAPVLHQVVLTALLISIAITFLGPTLPSQAPIALPTAAALVTIGSPPLINVTAGWSAAFLTLAYGLVLLFAFATTLAHGHRPTRKVAALLVLILLGPPLYHTIGFLIAIYFVLYWTLHRLTGLSHPSLSPITVVVYVVAYQTYVGAQFFQSVIGALRDVLTLEFLSRDSIVVAISPVQIAGIDLQLVNAALYALLTVPILLLARRHWGFLSNRFRRKPGPPDVGNPERHQSVVVLSLAAAVGVFAILMGLKFGLEFFLNRGASLLIVPAALAILTELRYRRRGYMYVYPLVAGVLALSLISFAVQASTVYSANHLSKDEDEAYRWLSAQLAPTDVVFTDFRLSAPFVADGHFRVVGITGAAHENTDDLLKGIYYSGSPDEISAALRQITTVGEGRPPDYLFLSRLMTQDYPGINAYGGHFRPAVPDFLHALSRSTDWRLAYSNGDALVFESKTHHRQVSEVVRSWRGGFDARAAKG